MKHGSLFSGIGGFDLAAEWMGWENVFHCEIAEFPRKILNHYWPKSESYEDIKKTDFTKWHGTVDIISGGFPCQPYSAAGKRLGKEDDRHLWPEMLRVIREVKPQWVVGENVRGLLNWNGGMVFHEVCADLENIGYEVQAFIIPASGINAPHQRERLWIVAHNINNRLQFTVNKEAKKEIFRKSKQETIKSNTLSFESIKANGLRWNSTNSYLHGFDKRNGNDEINASERGFNALNDIDQSNGIGNIANSKGESLEGLRRQKERHSKLHRGYDGLSNWQNFPAQSPVCGGDDGISHGLDNITFPKWRNESIKGYGNAVVPQVVYRIFKTIEYIQNLK
jgi:DNA (cytosine-5)-methyltransferase 1